MTDSEPSSSYDAARRLRVLHVINGEHYAGAERVQDLLGLRLPERGCEIGFACIKADKFPQLRRAQDVPLYRLPMRGRVDLRPAWALARVVRREGYELIHTHTPRTALIGRVASALTGAPMVHHLHSPTAADTTHRWRNWLNVLTEKISLNGVRMVIPVSHSLGGYARRKGISAERIAVIHNGVPTCGPLTVRAAPTGSWTIGVVALFRPRKGLEVLLDALAQLKARGLPVELRAIGAFETPGYEAEILERVRRLKLTDSIEWRGFQKDVGAELARLDLFVLPSLFGEGLPMVVLEAMAAGVPVVATNVEGVPEAVRHGIDGLIADAGDPASLAEAIAEFMLGRADWSALRANAHQRQAEHLSDEAMADAVMNVYRRVLGDAALIPTTQLEHQAT